MIKFLFRDRGLQDSLRCPSLEAISGDFILDTVESVCQRVLLAMKLFSAGSWAGSAVITAIVVATAVVVVTAIVTVTFVTFVVARAIFLSFSAGVTSVIAKAVRQVSPLALFVPTVDSASFSTVASLMFS